MQLRCFLKTLIRCLDGDLLKTGKFIYSMKEKMNFEDAQKFCMKLGLQLPMPGSIAENDEAGFCDEPGFLIGYWR